MKELIPVIVGGTIGIIGTLLAVGAAYLLQRSSRSTTARQLTREKAERLVLLGYRTYDDVTHFSAAVGRGTALTMTSSTDEMRMLAAFYFPDLEPDVHGIYEAERDFRVWALKREDLELGASDRQTVFEAHLKSVIDAVVALDVRVRKDVLPKLI